MEDLADCAPAEAGVLHPPGIQQDGILVVRPQLVCPPRRQLEVQALPVPRSYRGPRLQVLVDHTSALDPDHNPGGDHQGNLSPADDEDLQVLAPSKGWLGEINNQDPHVSGEDKRHSPTKDPAGYSPDEEQDNYSPNL